MPMSDEEIERRIEELNNSGMTLAAKALMRELNYRATRAAAA